MKNRKRFQKFMLSAVALTTLIPFTSQTSIVHARWANNSWTKNDPYNPQRPIRSKYGVAKIKGYNNKSNPAISPYLAIEQHSKNGSAMAKYVKDNDTSGSLVENKKISGQPFGGTTSKWSKSNEAGEGDTHWWYIYHLPKNGSNAGAGKVGMFYKNALTYYPNEKAEKGKGKNKTQKQPVKLDARLVWNGDYHYQYDKNKMPNLNVHFDSNHLAVKEPYTGEGNFSLLLTYASGKKKGQPFRVRSEVAQTDIDYQQGILFNTPSYIIVNKAGNDTKLNAGVDTNYGVKAGVQNGVARIFGEYGPTILNKKKENARQGTVLKTDPRGRFSYIPKKAMSEYNVTFVHDFNNENYGATSYKWATPASSYNLIKTKNIKNDPHRNADSEKYNADHAQADYFGFDFDKGTSLLYTVPVDKWVSKTDNFTKHSTKETISDTGSAYFDIHTSLKGPSTAFLKAGNTDKNYNALPLADAMNDKNDPYLAGTKKSKYAKKQLVLTDYIDPSLEVVSAKVYQSNWGDKYGKHRKNVTDDLFTVQKDKKGLKDKKGYTVVEAKMKPEATQANKSNTWYKNYHLVIQVKPKPDQQPAEGSIYSGSMVVNNQAWLNGKDSGAKSKLIVKYNHTDTTTKGDSKNGLTAHKYVYAADSKDPTKVKDTGAADMHDGTVYPNQYLYYRLRFKLNNFTQVEKKDGHPLTSSDGQKLVDGKYTFLHKKVLKDVRFSFLTFLRAHYVRILRFYAQKVLENMLDFLYTHF
ncbi:hypothetical protein [Lactobacillus sp. PV012]|uniref:hypothetical protein n=1 Tax=Lactobacillus sp. PV012 TaxID=2594494 RepID=UPI00224043BC|nr:hypothetical protein [Lactobacillus sp. PV012]QNQ82383.1 hypothetical protein FP433_04705 [Lactobacillus sp. PV012]